MKSSCLVILILAFCCISDEACAAAIKKSQPTAPQIVIRIHENEVLLSWSRLSGKWNYTVLVSASPDMNEAEVRAVVVDTFFIDNIQDDNL